MKNLSFLSLLSLAFLLSCSQEDPEFLLHKQNSLNLNGHHATIVQQAEVFPFFPAGEFGGPGNVLVPGTFFPPTKEGFATLKRGSNYIQFNIHTTGLPEGAYTVWYVIFNEKSDCNAPNPAGGACAGAGIDDFLLPTAATIWATGGVVKANGVGNFQDRLYVGERRESGTQEALIGADLASALENPQGAEVHLVIKYHGLASDDPDVLYEQTHTLMGNCGLNDGANSFDEGPEFGIQCFNPQAAIFPAFYENNDTMTTDAYSSQVVTQWMDLLLKLTQEGPGFTPPVAARAFGYTSLTLYESVRPGMPGYKTMAGQVNDLTIGMLPQVKDKAYHWGAVANAALATIIRSCYNNASTENLTAIDELEAYFTTQVFSTEANRNILNRSVAYGKGVGEAMVAYTISDNQGACYDNNFPESYVPPTGDGLWVPTLPDFQRALQPYWGEVRPFVTKNVETPMPPPPPVYSTNPASAFWMETMEVYNTVKNLTAEQKVIAEFWSDDPGTTATPPGHSISILKQILEDEDANLALAAEAFAKMGMGLHDAFISCWHAKYAYNLIRPITVIHQYIDQGFAIPLVTPPFPEYPSGHSVQSGAAAQILTDLFGNDYSFTDHLHESRTDIDGRARSFDSFDDFAEEAAISRLYGGIHYRAAIELGVVQGKEIGSNISNLVFK